MKKRLLIACMAVAVAAASWTIWANACEHDKQTSAQAANAGGTHEGCSAKAGTTSASTASTAGTSCEGHGASTTTASTAGIDCCMSKTKTTTASNDACNSKLAGAGMLGAPGGCTMTKGSTMTASAHGNCDACDDMMQSAAQLTANDVQTQIVPLKNGVMFVYTSDTPAHVRAVQTVLARRNDHLNELAQSGDHAKLCPECKNVRGALASGKMTRETVKVEGGCMTIVTSSDPATITKLRAMATAGSKSTANKI